MYRARLYANMQLFEILRGYALNIVIDLEKLPLTANH
jgi:hypothetical protein